MQLKMNNIILHYLSSYRLLSLKPLDLHKFEYLDEILSSIEKLSDEDLKDSFNYGMAARPILNIADCLL